MKLESTGIIIELKPFGERDLVGRVFTKDFGILVGIFKAGQVAKSKTILGQYGKVSWNARLDSQLGAFHFENEKNLITPFFNDSERLNQANSCFALLSKLSPERVPEPGLYSATSKFLISPWKETSYLEWEIALLTELGYGLSLNSCGNCGKTSGLTYISPKTGRAICKDCGAEYKDRLFSMPADLNVTKYFLEQIAEIPEIRKII